MNTSLRLNGSIDDHGKLSKLYFHVNIILSVWHYITSIIQIAMYITYCMTDHSDFLWGARDQSREILKIFPRNIPSSSALGKTLWSARLFKVKIPFQGLTDQTARTRLTISGLNGSDRSMVHGALIEFRLFPFSDFLQTCSVEYSVRFFVAAYDIGCKIVIMLEINL